MSRSMTFIRSCSSDYLTLAMMATSWQSAHRLNRILGGSRGLYGAKKVIIFWRMASGVGRPYVFMSWSKMSFRDIDAFHPMVGGVLGGVP